MFQKPLVSDTVSSCMFQVTKLQESQQFMRTQRDAVAKEYRNYTCADETLNTTTPIATSTFVHQETQYTVDVRRLAQYLNICTQYLIYCMSCPCLVWWTEHSLDFTSFTSLSVR